MGHGEVEAGGGGGKYGGEDGEDDQGEAEPTQVYWAGKTHCACAYC